MKQIRLQSLEMRVYIDSRWSQARGELFFDWRVKIMRATFRRGPLNPARGLGSAVTVSSPSVVWGGAHPKSNLLHFSLKIWQAGGSNFNDFAENQLTCVTENISFQKNLGVKYHYDVWPHANFWGSFDPLTPRFPRPWMSQSSDGKLFHTVGPESEKARPPSFVLLLTVTADLVVNGGVRLREPNKVLKVCRTATLKDIVH